VPIKPAFSAVELLLVAGIASILVAIAVPGYMEAKARAETADVSSLLRQVEMGLVQYKIAYNHFLDPPYSIVSPNPLRRLVNTELVNFEPVDRFKDGLIGYGGYYVDPYLGYGYWTPEGDEYHPTLNMINQDVGVASSGGNNGYVSVNRYWYLKSIGPDQTDWNDEGGERNSNKKNRLGRMVDYDPTNGVFSLGEIIRYGSL